MPLDAPAEANVPAEVRLRDLRASDVPVSIVARVVTAERREIVRKSDGGRRPVLSGLLSDGTASVRFTWWDPPSDPIERGEVLRAVNVQVREFQGRVELNFNWKSRVAPAGDAELPVVRPEDLPLRSLSELRAGDDGFRVVARIVRVSPKTVSVGEERRLLHEGVVADSTGAVAFTAWSDFGLKPGEAIDVSGGYARGFRGRPQLVLDEGSTVRRVPGEGLPSAEAIGRGALRRISDIETSGGGELLELHGVVVALLPPSGLVYRCPECRRSVRQGLCRVHGAVSAEPDLRARLVVDDGTGVLTVNAGRAETEGLWGRTLDDCLTELRANPDPSLLEEHLFEAVFGRRVLVRGRGSADDFGVTIYPDAIEVERPDPAARARALAAQLGGKGS
jgi:ssDNA-binding replication factor A large subunit